MLAYDYDSQRWTDGPEGTDLQIRQIADELELIESPRGAEYLRMIGSRHTPAEAAELARVRLHSLMAQQ